MNDDVSPLELERLRAEHRRLDADIQALIEGGATDQIEIARLKKRKLKLKDEIQLILDTSTPDIIA